MTDAANTPAGDGAFVVEGAVRLPRAADLSGLHVEVVRRSLRADVVLGTATTDREGRYSTAFFLEPTEDRPDIVVRVRAAADVESPLVGSSDLRYDAGRRETIDVAATDRPSALRSEHDVLVGDLARHVEGRGEGRAGGVLTGDEATYVSRKTGWDARAVMFASVAEQLSRDNHLDDDSRLDPEWYYSLLRAGLGPDEAALFATDGTTLQRGWRLAMESGVISSDREADIPAVAELFGRIAAKRLLDARRTRSGSTMRELVRAALDADGVERTDADREDRERRFAELSTGERQPAQFWDAVEREFGHDVAQRAALDGQLAAMTFDDSALMARLHAETAAPITAPVDLVRRGYFRADRWLAHIDTDVPDFVPEGSADDRRMQYADLLATRVRTRYPTAVVGELVRDIDSVRAPGGRELGAAVSDFLVEHTDDFDIGSYPIEQYLRGRDGAPPDDAVVEQIKRIQRVYQITPSDEAMTTLLDRGIDSAYAIAGQDVDEFIAAHAADLGETDARTVHARALQVHNAVLHVAASYLTARAAPVLGWNADAPVLRASAPERTTFSADEPPVIAYPTLEGLFGAMDYCVCEECRSVVSPAAYLVDLLLFTGESGGAQQVLLKKRPDLQHLQLSCENTNTLVPYIDLVNETLEQFVVNGLSIDGYRGHDTDADLDSDVLLAIPQFVDDRAYVALATQWFPAPMPFAKDLERLRRILGSFGVSLADAMDRMRSAGSGVGGWRDILLERAGLSRVQHRLLTAGTDALADLYGFAPSTSMASIVETLSSAKTYARRLRIDYQSLDEVVSARFVSGAASSRRRALALIDPTGSADPDDFGALHLRAVSTAGDASPIEAVDLVALVRFVRLRDALGWPTRVADKVFVALAPSAIAPPDSTFGVPELDSACTSLVDRLGWLCGLTARMGVRSDELVEFAACWADIDVDDPDSLYRRLFLRTTLPGQPGVLSGPEWRSAVAAGNVDVRIHEAVIKAAFRLDAGEFETVVSAIPAPTPSVTLLQQLSAIHRRVWLARRLDLPLADLFALTSATGLDPFAPLDVVDAGGDALPPPIVQLLDLLDALLGAGVPPQSMLHLLWNVDADVSQDQQDGQGLAADVGVRFAAIEATLLTASDPASAAAHQMVTNALGARAADILFGYLDRRLTVDTPYTQAAPALSATVIDAGGGLLTYDAARSRLSYPGRMTDRRRDALVALADVSTTFVDAINELFRLGATMVHTFVETTPDLGPLLDVYDAADAPADGRQDVMAAIIASVREVRRHDAAIQAIAAAAAIDARLAAALLDDAAVMHGSASAGPAIDDVYAVATDPPATAAERLGATLARVRRATTLARLLGLTVDEVVHSAADTAIDPSGWINSLPIGDAPTASASLLRMARSLLALTRLKSMAGGGPVVEALRTAASAGADTTAVATAFGWDARSLGDVIDRLGLTIRDLASIDRALQVEDALDVVHRLGVPAATVLDSITNEPSAAVVDALLAGLRARFDEDTWLAFIGPVNDVMRTRQRDALVAKVLFELAKNEATASIDTPDKLFEFFLMDVQMQPQVRTTRVRNALAAVQAFVERCLMNLEPQVAPTSIDAGRWEWMKRYRVWEANRKVFLWPENWLEPELRTDQSAFFRSTMSELLQSDITEEAATTALLGYLARLADVAKLEPCGIHNEDSANVEDQFDDVTHVVARTPGADRRHYYRRRESGSWTPWEQIPLDVEDNPVLPVVWKGRRFLFWLKLMKDQNTQSAQETTTSTPDSDEAVAGLSMRQLKQVAFQAAGETVLLPKAVLCWSEYYNGKWQSARTSDVNLPAAFSRQFAISAFGSFDRTALVLGASEEGKALRIRIWDRHNPEELQGSSFLFYNSHSLPVRAEDGPPALDIDDNSIQERHISVEPYDGAFSLQAKYVDIEGNLETRPIVTWQGRGAVRLTTPYPYRYAHSTSPSGGSQQGLMDNVWEAPFFFEDSRHVFYVSSSDVPSAQHHDNSLDPIPRHVGVLEVPELDVFGTSTAGGSPTVRYAIGPDASVAVGDLRVNAAGSVRQRRKGVTR